MRKDSKSSSRVNAVRGANILPAKGNSGARGGSVARSATRWNSLADFLVPASKRDWVTHPVFVGGVLWLAYPPLSIDLIALVALIPLLLMVEQPEGLKRRHYVSLWLAGCIFWLLLLQGIRLAFWPLYAGWIALSIYLAVYLPLFVGLTRVARWRYGIPLAIAAPLVWVGLECVRAYALTGFAGCMLGHAVADLLPCIQIADQFGTYGVAAMVVLCNVLVFQLVNRIAFQRRTNGLEMLGGFVVIAAWIGYGIWRLQDDGQAESPIARIALVQDVSPTQFEANYQRNAESWSAYAATTADVAKLGQQIDLVVWPESIFTRNEPYIVNQPGEGVPLALREQVSSQAELQEVASVAAYTLKAKASTVLAPFGARKGIERPHLLVGSDYWSIQGERFDRFNTALFISPNAELLGVYKKRHLVMFGEYVPGLSWFPNLQRMIGLATLDVGKEPFPFTINKATVLPLICFENMLPQLVQKQLRECRSLGREVDVLVTLTNDGWFRGSSMLDHHLACGRMAAVANRRPMLVAANTGISAWIDGSGRLLERTKKMQAAHIVAKPTRDNRVGLWTWIGDWPARIAGLMVGILAMVAVHRHWKGGTRVNPTTK